MANSITMIKANYKNDDEITTELDSNLHNFLEFDNNGKYELRTCEDCNGPMIGHLKVKCPKVEYSEDDEMMKI